MTKYEILLNGSQFGQGDTLPSRIIEATKYQQHNDWMLFYGEKAEGDIEIPIVYRVRLHYVISIEIAKDEPEPQLVNSAYEPSVVAYTKREIQLAINAAFEIEARADAIRSIQARLDNDLGVDDPDYAERLLHYVRTEFPQS